MKQREARSGEQENDEARELGVPFSEIPHQSKLFLEYLSDPVSLKKYYPNAVGSFAEITAFVPEVLDNYTTDRTSLCDALKEINSRIGAKKNRFENIELLREPDTVAVVTGQQAGLFTGPLYTIYKALSAVKMAEYLNANGTKAVPVFWIATEDHDFDEVSRAFLTGGSGELVETEYQPKKYVKGSPVGNVEIDNSIARAISETFDKMPHTEFSDEVRNSLEQAWAEVTLFGAAFAKNLANILGKFGLIFVDPMHDGLKTLAAPIYADAIEKSDEIVAEIRNKSSELESEGFHAQVLVEEGYFPLFWHDDEGRRTALRKVEHNLYRTKDKNQEFSLTDLAEIAKREPQRFSPGVMLRPVVQDYLFPTVCYFGGAAEIAYFAQNSEAYRILERPVAPILHRQSFTVVEAKHRRTLDRFELVFSDLFAGLEQTLENVGRRQLSSETATLFAEVEEKINIELNRLGQNLSEFDPTLAENLAKRRRKIIYHIAALNKKANLSALRKDEVIERQIRSAFNALLPKGQLQERTLNVNSFLNKYGSHFIDWVYEAIDLDKKDHHVVEL
ncbi:MAG: bacillithiol biosynthesis cysteine-adding enzyme BshC [Pyrinomonadaceae bacterium]